MGIDAIFKKLKPFESLNNLEPDRYYRDNTIYSIYYIESPIVKEHEGQKQSNHRYLPIIVAHTDKITSKIVKFTKLKVSLSLLPFLSIGDVINTDGSISNDSLETTYFTGSYNDISWTFETLDTDKTLLKLFGNISDIRSLGLQKEMFLKIKSNDNENIYIPCIEVIRHFYANTSYLAELVLSPLGIGQTYSFYEYNPIEDKHYLNLMPLARYSNRHQLFYFIQNNAYATMFNSIFFNWEQTGIIQAPIPFIHEKGSPIRFNASFTKLNTSEDYLIYRIHNSSFMRSELRDKKLSIYHPRKNINKNASANDKEDSELHVRSAKINRQLDTDSKTDSMLNVEYLYDNSLDQEDEFDFKIQEEKREGEEFDCNLKIVTHSEEGDEVGLSTNEGLSRGGKAARLEIDRENLEIVDGDAVDLGGLIEELSMRGFRVTEIDGVFEDAIKDKAITEYKAQAYADPILSVRRSYKLLTVVSENGDKFYLLDAQEREPEHFLGGNKSTRPGILVFPAPETENFEEEFVRPLLANIIVNGASWFTRKNRNDRISPIDTIYGYKNKSSSLRHIRNPERFADSILRAVTKLRTKKEAE